MENRTHSAPYRGYATGGRTGVEGLAQTVLGRFPGLSITSAYRPGDPGYHGKNEARDLGGDSRTMLQAAAWIGSHFGRSLTEGIHNPNLSVKYGKNVPPSFWGEPTWAEHANHIHIAIAGAIAAMGAATGTGVGMGVPHIKVRAPRSKNKGVPGLLANAAMAAHAKGLQAKINQRIGAGAGAGAGYAGKGTLSFQQIVGLARRAGMPNPVLMAHIAEAESGGRVGVVNSIGATGLWQIYNHPDLVAKYGPMTNAWNNALAARDLLRTQGLGAWAASQSVWGRYAAKGGRIPNFAGWFRGGGSFTANGPTVFGAGEGGSERVSITPAGRRQASVQIGHITIHNGKRGDIKQQLKEEVQQAFRELSHEMNLDFSEEGVLT
jgi:hypothetical protein